jgi:hypothetical protein
MRVVPARSGNDTPFLDRGRSRNGGPLKIPGGAKKVRSSEGQLEDWDISGESKNSGQCKNPGTLAGEVARKTVHTQSGADERLPQKPESPIMVGEGFLS